MRLGKGFVGLYGRCAACHLFARERAEFEALRATLEWLQHKSPDVCASIFISPSAYRILFGSQNMPELDDLLTNVRRLHVTSRAEVVIKPDRNQSSPQIEESKPSLSIAIQPNSRLRRAA